MYTNMYKHISFHAQIWAIWVPWIFNHGRWIFKDIGLEKVSFHSNPRERHCKECSNYCTVALNSHASKVMHKILQQYVNQELPDVQGRFRKGRGTRDQIANICWIIKKQESSRKASTSALLIMSNLWLCGSQQTGKFFKRWENQTIWPASWEICMQVKK